MAKDFARSAFDITIARCQQRALSYANMSVPDPAQQLELLNAKRKKGTRGGAAILSRDKQFL